MCRTPKAKELKLHSKHAEVAKGLTIGKLLSKELITKKTGESQVLYWW